MALEFLTTYMTARNQKAPGQAPEVSLQESQRRALDANAANAPLTEMLTRRTNEFNQKQQLDLLEMAVPGYSKWASQMTSNADSYSRGEMSDEMQNNLGRLAAERGIKTGVRGQANDYSLLRDFGMNQYQANAQSQSIMGQLASLSRINPMSPLSMMVTPSQSLTVDESNRSAKQEWMNAEQASQNIRKNAFWYGLSAGDATFGQASGMGGGGGGGGGANSMFKGMGSKKGGGGGGMNDGASNDGGGGAWADSFGGGGAGDASSFGGGATDMGGGMDAGAMA